MTAIFEDMPRTKINTGTTHTEGTLAGTGESREMFLSAKSEVILNTLTKLYAKPGLATLRELSSNAIDAHVALKRKVEQETGAPAGEGPWDRPIEITMPSHWDNSLVVKDYGIGMDKNVLMNVYAGYGESLKVGDNDQIGAFGLGAKTPLGISQQYTLTTVQDGKKIVALIFLNERNIGQVNIISEEETDEPSGTEITVPVSDVNAFLSDARDFFYTWKPGTVLVDGKQPKSMYDGKTLTTEDESIFYTVPTPGPYGFRNPGNRQLILVAGGINYTVDLSSVFTDNRGMHYNHKTAADYYRAVGLPTTVMVNVLIGNLDLTPAREDLMYTEKTKAVIKRAFDAAIENLPSIVLRSISESENRAEALENYVAWQNVIQTLIKYNALKLEDILWNGEQVKRTLDVDCQSITYNNNRAIRSDAQRLDLANCRNNRISIFYSVLDKDKRQNGMARVRQFLNNRDMDLENSMFLLFTEKPDNKWLTENPRYVFVEWDTVIEESREWSRKQREIAKQNKAKGVKAAAAATAPLTYPILRVGADGKIYQDEVDVNDLTGTVYYCEQNDKSGRYHHNSTSYPTNVLRAAYSFGVTDSLVIIAPTRKPEAFANRVPDGVKVAYIKDTLFDKMAEEAEALTVTERAALAQWHAGYGKDYRALTAANNIADFIEENADKVEDKALVEAVRVHKFAGEGSALRKRFDYAANILATSVANLMDKYDIERTPDQPLLSEYLMTRYPLTLATDIVSNKDDHILAYVNMVFSANL